MRIMVGNDAVNIRETNGTLWYPRLEAAVIQKMDSMFERVSPTVLQWDKNKPKKENVEEEFNPETPQVDVFRKKTETLDFPTEE